MTPFVGRDQEVALLIDRWRDATEGEGQVVLLSGEAGIGKSRISDRAARVHWRRVSVVLRYQCSPHHVKRRFPSDHRPNSAGGRPRIDEPATHGSTS